MKFFCKTNLKLKLENKFKLKQIIPNLNDIKCRGFVFNNFPYIAILLNSGNFVQFWFTCKWHSIKKYEKDKFVGEVVAACRNWILYDTCMYEL